MVVVDPIWMDRNELVVVHPISSLFESLLVAFLVDSQVVHCQLGDRSMVASGRVLPVQSSWEALELVF